MSGKTVREVLFQMLSAMRSPSKEPTSSAKVATISLSSSIIEPETSRQSTMSRVASTSARTSRSTGRAVSADAATATSASAAAASASPPRSTRSRRRYPASDVR
ncbi:hypothetical protein [Georgenia yuyongxinii]